MRLFGYALVIALLLAPLGAGIAHAQEGETAVWQGVHNGMEVTVTVVARGHRIPERVRQSEPWWQWGNTTTDAYLFTFTIDRLVDLIVDFALVEGHPQAAVYVPWLSTQRLNIQIDNGSYTVPKDLPPSLTLWPRQGGWLVNGKANFDLEGRESDAPNHGPLWGLSVGADSAGLPQWATRTLLEDRNPGAGYTRFGAAVRADPEAPYALATPLMPSWPYLSMGSGEADQEQNRPIYYDLIGRIITEVWVGFHTAGMYQINSLAYPPRTDFEAPFAFYRFDPAAGRNPNLVIRSDIWPEGDRLGPPIPEVQRTAMRMTWTEDNAARWRYSLTVNGNHAMTEPMLIGDTVVRVVPYEKLPMWVAGQAWKAVTFVEATQGEPGSEGIYDYSVEDNYPVSFWVNGHTEERPESFRVPYLDLATIDPNRLKQGFRGEYSLVYDRVPQLYFSPVDNRVHLLYAQGGVWNLDDVRVLRMHNLSGGRQIDSWTREYVPEEPPEKPAKQTPVPEGTVRKKRALPGKAEEALYSFGDYLLYSGPEGMELRRAAYQPAGFAIAPPTDKASWQSFKERLAPYAAQTRDPWDLRGWLNAFPGTGLAVAGGEVSGVRVVPDGFRFVLGLPPGFQPQGDDIVGVAGLTPGQYAVSYNGAFTIAPLTPPILSATLTGGALQQLEQNGVQVVLRNDGQEDLPEATLELWATASSGPATRVATRKVALLGREELPVTVQWAPRRAGEWTLTPRLLLPDDRTITLESASFTVLAASTPGLGTVLGVSARPGQLPLALWTLGLFAAVAAVAFRRAWRTSRQQE